MPRPPDSAPARSRRNEPESLGGDEGTVDRRRLQVEPALVDAVLLAVLLGGVSVRHVRSLHSRGLLPSPHRLGSRVLWNREEILAWIRAGLPPRAKWEAMRDTRECEP